MLKIIELPKVPDDIIEIYLFSSSPKVMYLKMRDHEYVKEIAKKSLSEIVDLYNHFFHISKDDYRVVYLYCLIISLYYHQTEEAITILHYLSSESEVPQWQVSISKTILEERITDDKS